MTSLLHRVGGWCASHAKRTLAAWLLLLAILAAGVAAVGMNLSSSYKITNIESIRGLETLAERLPQASGTSEQVLFTADRADVASHRAAIEGFVKKANAIDGVSVVTDPFSQLTGAVSPDGEHALVLVQTDSTVGVATGKAGPKAESVSNRLTELVDATHKSNPGLTIQRAGTIGKSTSVDVSTTEFVGLVVATIVLLLTLGSVLAAGAPLVSALVGVAIGMLGILLAASVTDIDTTTPVLAIMIGVAVGIDYALFIISRAREDLAKGAEPKEAAAKANATAGSAVVFAGGTVIVALCGLAVARIPFLTTMGVASAAVVAIAVLVSVTAVPAFLGLLGTRLAPKERDNRANVARRWVRFVTRVPALTVLAVIGLLAIAALPLDQIRLSLLDNGHEPKGTVQRDSYDAISKAFGPGYNSPILVVADIEKTDNPLVTVVGAAEKIGKLEGVKKVGLATPSPDGTFAFIQVIPEKGQSDPQTMSLVKEIRDAAPSLERDLRLDNVVVTGETAVAIDIASQLSKAVLPFGIVVIGLSLIILLFVFRSIAVPIVATLGYLLSLGAGMGAVGAIFGWGWAAGLLNVAKVGAVISFLPVIVMGVLFGLAMDYQVFLVSRMREVWLETGDAKRAVRDGFVGSAKVVAAAAVIMTGVFAAFVPHGIPAVKPIAVALTVGVAVDAFLVRMTLIPAVMTLLGEKAWWIPRWLDRLLPKAKAH